MPNGSPQDLFDTVRLKLGLRPGSFAHPGFHNLLRLVLQEHLNHASILESGLLLEFGVGPEANSANVIAKHVQEVWRTAQRPETSLPCVFGFDSFRGLPRKWNNFERGTFRLRGQELPRVESNVELVIGWFNETVVPFVKGVQAGARAAAAQ